MEYRHTIVPRGTPTVIGNNFLSDPSSLSFSLIRLHEVVSRGTQDPDRHLSEIAMSVPRGTTPLNTAEPDIDSFHEFVPRGTHDQMLKTPVSKNMPSVKAASNQPSIFAL